MPKELFAIPTLSVSENVSLATEDVIKIQMEQNNVAATSSLFEVLLVFHSSGDAYPWLNRVRSGLLT